MYWHRGCCRTLGIAADAHGFLALGYLNLSDARFFQQFNELLDLSDIHGFALS
jgi:hypothetical protein